MKADLATQAEKIIAFTGWDVSDEDIARALPLVDFAYMQKNERTTLLKGVERRWKADKKFFREGGIGKNRAQLSPEQEARIVARGRRDFTPECFDFVFSQGV